MAIIAIVLHIAMVGGNWASWSRPILGTVLPVLPRVLLAAARQCPALSSIVILSYVLPIISATPTDSSKWPIGAGLDHFPDFWAALVALFAMEGSCAFAVTEPSALPPYDGDGQYLNPELNHLDMKAWEHLVVLTSNAPREVVTLVKKFKLRFREAITAIAETCVLTISFASSAEATAVVSKALAAITSVEGAREGLINLDLAYERAATLGSPVPENTKVQQLRTLLPQLGLVWLAQYMILDATLQKYEALKGKMLDLLKQAENDSGTLDDPALAVDTGVVNSATTAAAPLTRTEKAIKESEDRIMKCIKSLEKRMATIETRAAETRNNTVPGSVPYCWRCGKQNTDRDHTRTCREEPSDCPYGSRTHMAKFHDDYTRVREKFATLRAEKARSTPSTAAPSHSVQQCAGTYTEYDLDNIGNLDFFAIDDAYDNSQLHDANCLELVDAAGTVRNIYIKQNSLTTDPDHEENDCTYDLDAIAESIV